MDWNALKSFLAVAEAGSLVAGARALGVNHSTVYRRLRAFEEQTGGRLFEVVNNRYQLTPMGSELLVLAKNIAAGFEGIERHILGKDFLPKGSVKITAPFNLANHYLPQALAPLRERYPDIHIEVLSTNLEVNMNSRIADIAVRATPKPPEYLVGRNVARIPWGVFASPAYLNAAPALASLDDLARHTLIGGAGQMLNLPAFSWLDQHFGERITTRADELSAMYHFARVGQGVAFLPLDQLREGLRYCLAYGPGKASDLWVLTHPDLRRTARIRLVTECLVNYFGAIDFSAEGL